MGNNYQQLAIYQEKKKKTRRRKWRMGGGGMGSRLFGTYVLVDLRRGVDGRRAFNSINSKPYPIIFLYYSII